MNEALTALLNVLDELGILYFAVGSVASSIHGLPRFTQDIDLVAQIEPAQIDRLTSLTANDFYMDKNEARGALVRGRAFNLIHLASAYKIDIFPLGHDAFHASELSRARAEDWTIPNAATVRLPVASAEDTVLSKLVWYRQGGLVSDRQWTDILGIASLRSLDWIYLREWASKLAVSELLEKLFIESSLTG
jgi:hypothetical protein